MAELIESFRPMVRDLTRFDRSKITYVIAVRNALGVVIPLAVGALTRHPLPGLAASTGALNVGFSDRPGPYRLQAIRMLTVSLIGALSVFIGGGAGPDTWLTVILIAVWGLAGGMMVVFGPAVEQAGLTGIILLLVYGGLRLTPYEAAVQAGFILAGGLFQTALSIAAWPLRLFGPERRTLASVFRALAAYSRSPMDSGGAPPTTGESSTARSTLAGLASARGERAEAFRAALDEAERLRLELVALAQLTAELSASRGQAVDSTGLGQLWSATGHLLGGVADAVDRERTVPDGSALLHQAEQALTNMRRAEELAGRDAPLLAAMIAHGEALLGQLRACVDIVNSESATGTTQTRTGRAAWPAAERLSETVSVLRANLTLRSTSFRHALRLAITLAIATALARQFGLTRSYWVPLTVAIVLKPDFASTFTRGVLRVAGTLIGLVLATVLVHLVAEDLDTQIALLGLLTFAIRNVGPANFGVSAVAITALVVILLSLAGGSPEALMYYRGLDTLVGGLLALTAYAVWPTWE